MLGSAFVSLDIIADTNEIAGCNVLLNVADLVNAACVNEIAPQVMLIVLFNQLTL